jgi:hypothetical protein
MLSTFKTLFNFALSIAFFAAPTFASKPASAAACCGGGSGVPGIIVGDEKANLTFEISNLHIKTDVSQQSIWRDRSEVDSTSSLRLQYTQVFNDRFQTGISTSFIRRDRGDYSSSGLGDTSLHIGYETLPEWNYSSWRPRAVSYIGLTMPTGRSIYEAEDLLLLDSRGKGFWSARIGTAFTKVVGHWSFISNIELVRTFSRSFDTLAYEGIIEPQNAVSAVVGTGYSLGDVTLQASLLHLYESQLILSGPPSSVTEDSQVSTLTVGGSMPIGSENINGDLWFLRADYFDQRLFGDPKNTALSTGVSVSFRRSFSR